MENLSRIIAEHPFFAGLPEAKIDEITGCTSNVRFAAGEYVFKTGEAANAFYLLRAGRVSTEMYIPHKGPLIIDTVEEGSVFGWSWLIPPYCWHFDARALILTRAIKVDTTCIRKKMDTDMVLGYFLMSRFAQVLEQQLQVTRLQLINVYEDPVRVAGVLD